MRVGAIACIGRAAQAVMSSDDDDDRSGEDGAGQAHTPVASPSPALTRPGNVASPAALATCTAASGDFDANWAAAQGSGPAAPTRSDIAAKAPGSKAPKRRLTDLGDPSPADEGRAKKKKKKKKKVIPQGLGNAGSTPESDSVAKTQTPKPKRATSRKGKRSTHDAVAMPKGHQPRSAAQLASVGGPQDEIDDIFADW